MNCNMKQESSFFSLMDEAERQLYGVLGPEARKFRSDVEGHVNYVEGVYDPGNRHVSGTEMNERVEDIHRAVNDSLEILSELSERRPEDAAYYISRNGIETGEQVEERFKGLLREYSDVYGEIEASARRLEESGEASASLLLDDLEGVL